MSCEHTTTADVEATKDVAGLKFEYHTKECASCKAVLWSQENERQFQTWLGEQWKEDREKFTIQKVALPPDLIEFAKKLAADNLSDESNVYQACLSLYFFRITGKSSITKKMEECQPGVSADVDKKKFRVNPKVLVKLDANAKLFGLHRNQVASWIITRVLWLAKLEYEDIASEIEYSLKAA